MTEAMRVHLRLSSTLPSRRHEWVAPNLTVEQGCKRSENEEAALKRELRECEANGMSRREMREKYRLGDRTIQKLLGPGKQGRPLGWKKPK